MRSLLVFTVVLVGCGSSHEREDADADAGVRPDAFVPRDTGVPDECRVETSAMPPYATVLRFENETEASLFIGEDCRYRFSVRSCASGYEPVALYADCTVPCSSPDMGCIACGSCMQRAVPVAPGEAVEVAWSGVAYTFDSTAMGCTCSNELNASAGRYRVEIPVYDTALAAESSGAPIRTVQTDFSLPSPGGVVTVRLGGPS